MSTDMSIKITVSADLDLSGVQQKLNTLGQQIAQANKTQFAPVSKTSLQDLQRMAQQFEALKRVSGDLRKRINATGQGGAGFFDLDWNALYPDSHSRSRQMAKAFSYVTGHAIVPPAQKPGGGRQSPTGSAAGGVVAGAAQAGLRAASGVTGGVGGVAAKALGTGMSAGFGAGLMGLIGGVVALGVGKAVGAVAEHIGKAEQGNVDMDRLKRTLGDVGVQFEALKASVHGSADALRITFDEAGKLGMQFSKLANLSGPAAAGEIAGELSSSVGLARSLGLDPSQTTGVLGQMRGVGVTRTEQDTRRFALLIGETIGKAGAFAKADEVMEAIGNYATMQTRSSMGGANLSGYAGLLAGMVGSGIPGLDPTGAGAMLARMNAALAAGGAKGEASQFATAMVGQRMGLDPLQTQVLREGGMFASNDRMFGGGSAYARYMGKVGPGGEGTFYDATRQFVEQAYAGDSDDAKLLRAQAFANHTGLNMNQAMAMLSVNSKAMGEMARFGDVAGFNASGITGIATAVSGSAADRQRLADDLLGRTGRGALSKEDADALRNARGTDDKALRELLAQLSAKYGQEETTGSVARDSKALLDNIKTNIADKLVPYMNDMREGILYLAGGREKTGVDVLKEIAEKGSDYRRRSIEKEFDVSGLQGRAADLRGQLEMMPTEGRLRDRLRAGIITPEQHAEQVRRREQLETQLDLINTDILEKTRQKEALLGKEVARLKNEQGEIDARVAAQQKIDDATRDGSAAGESPRAGRAPVSAAGPASQSLREAVTAAEKEIGAPPGLLLAQMEQESGFNPNAVSHRGAMGLAQVMPSTLRSLEKRFGRKLDPFNQADAVLMQKEVMRENHAHFGSWDDALRAYNGGWDRSRWGNKETRGYVPAIHSKMERGPRVPMSDDAIAARRAVGVAPPVVAPVERAPKPDAPVAKPNLTPMPDDAVAARRAADQYMNIRGSFDPLAITLTLPDGTPAAPPQHLNPRFSTPTFGRPS